MFILTQACFSLLTAHLSMVLLACLSQVALKDLCDWWDTIERRNHIFIMYNQTVDLKKLQFVGSSYWKDILPCFIIKGKMIAFTGSSTGISTFGVPKWGISNMMNYSILQPQWFHSPAHPENPKVGESIYENPNHLQGHLDGSC